MGEYCFSMEQEIKFMVPLSNGYIYRHRVGELGENAKRLNGINKMLSISLLGLFIKLHSLLYFLTQK